MQISSSCCMRAGVAPAGAPQLRRTLVWKASTAAGLSRSCGWAYRSACHVDSTCAACSATVTPRPLLCHSPQKTAPAQPQASTRSILISCITASHLR